MLSGVNTCWPSVRLETCLTHLMPSTTMDLTGKRKDGKSSSTFSSSWSHSSRKLCTWTWSSHTCLTLSTTWWNKDLSLPFSNKCKSCQSVECCLDKWLAIMTLKLDRRGDFTVTVQSVYPSMCCYRTLEALLELSALYEWRKLVVWGSLLTSFKSFYSILSHRYFPWKCQLI